MSSKVKTKKWYIKATTNTGKIKIYKSDSDKPMHSKVKEYGFVVAVESSSTDNNTINVSAFIRFIRTHYYFTS